MLGLVFAVLSGLGTLICTIIVLRKLFSKEGAMKGFIGLFCALYAYVWGWMNQGEEDLMDVMFIWTISMLLGLVANLMVNPASFS